MRPKPYKFSVKICLIGLALSCVNVAMAQQKPVFVVVHGAWGGSWAFKKVDSLMTAQNCTVYRPSLTGLGERVHLATDSTDLSTHIRDVVNMILFEDLDNVILIGHSYGGMVITGVADQLHERIRKLVYLDAIVPEHGESVLMIMDPKKQGITRMIQGNFLVPPWVGHEQPPPKDVPHPLNTFTEPISLTNREAQKLPATYILTVDPGRNADDDDFAPSAARAKARGWRYREMRADHNPQWSAVEELVAVFLDERN